MWSLQNGSTVRQTGVSKIESTQEKSKPNGNLSTKWNLKTVWGHLIKKILFIQRAWFETPSDQDCISRSYCMVCACVQEDNPQALASGLSKYTHKTIQQLAYCTSMHFDFVHCKIFDVNP